MDALSCKNKVDDTPLDHSDEKELLELRKIDAKIEIVPRESLLAQLKLRSLLRDRLLEAQQKDVEVGKIRDKVKSGVETTFRILEDGIIVYRSK
jgi:hypothetical protein